MRRVELIIPGKPQGKGRPRVTRYGTYTPESTRRYEKAVREAWTALGEDTFLPGPLAVEVTANFTVPKSYSKKRKAGLIGEAHTKKPDADNIAKAVLDALNGLAYDDDSCVARLSVTKRYADCPTYPDGFVVVQLRQEDEYEG